MIQDWKTSMDEYKKKREAGEPSGNCGYPGPFPVVSTFSTYKAYAFEDTAADPESNKPCPIAEKHIECDEHLWNAVRDSFRTIFPIEEVPGKLPESLSRIGGTFKVSLRDSYGERVLAVTREWGRREAASLGDGAPLFTEMFALSAMTAIGMDNPHADETAMLRPSKETIRKGLEESEKRLKPVLTVLRKKTEKIVERLTAELFEKEALQIRASEETAAEDEDFVPIL